jgi:hypothetical protein
MCTGNCPISNYCYRYTAVANPYGQTYSKLEEVCLSSEKNKYSEFIPDEKKIKEDEEISFNDILLAEIHKLMDKTN